MIITYRKSISVNKSLIDWTIGLLVVFTLSCLAFFVYSVKQAKKDLNIIQQDIRIATQQTNHISANLPVDFNVWIADKMKAIKVENTLLISSQKDKEIKSVKYAYRKGSLNPLFVYFIYTLNSPSYQMASSMSTINEFLAGNSAALDSIIGQLIPKRINPGLQSIIITDYATSSLIDTTGGRGTMSLTKLATLVYSNDTTFSMKEVAAKVKE